MVGRQRALQGRLLRSTQDNAVMETINGNQEYGSVSPPSERAGRIASSTVEVLSTPACGHFVVIQPWRLTPATQLDRCLKTGMRRSVIFQAASCFVYIHGLLPTMQYTICT